MPATPTRSAATALAAVLALAGAGLAADPPEIEAPPAIFATVDGRGAVSLKDARGRVVARLARGSYTLTVQDRSRARTLRLVGPGVSRATGLRFRGAAIWGVSLRRGTYHITSLRGRPGARPSAVTRVLRVR